MVADEVPSSVSASSNSSGQDKVKEFLMKWHFWTYLQLSETPEPELSICWLWPAWNSFQQYPPQHPSSTSEISKWFYNFMINIWIAEPLNLKGQLQVTSVVSSSRTVLFVRTNRSLYESKLTRTLFNLNLFRSKLGPLNRSSGTLKCFYAPI